LREAGVAAACVADHAPDRFGRGDIYLVVPPEEWSRANEIVETSRVSRKFGCRLRAN